MIILDIRTWYNFVDWIVKRKERNIYRYFEMSFSCFRPFGVWGVTISAELLQVKWGKSCIIMNMHFLCCSMLDFMLKSLEYMLWPMLDYHALLLPCLCYCLACDVIVTTQKKALATFVLYLIRTSNNWDSLQLLIKPNSTQYMPDVGLITHLYTSHN